MTAETTTANKIKNIANNIREIREGKGYTQEYVAMKLGLSQNAFSKIELGYTKITLERLYQISALLEINILSLMDEGAPEKNTLREA